MATTAPGRRVASLFMAQPLPSYLRTFRRRWALSQRELAELLGGITRGAIFEIRDFWNGIRAWK